MTGIENPSWAAAKEHDDARSTAIGFYVRGTDFVAAARYVREGAARGGAPRLSTDDPWMHMFLHGAELLLKAVCLAADPTCNPRRHGHRLQDLYAASRASPLGGVRMEQIERGMKHDLGAIPVAPDVDQAVAILNGASAPRAGAAAHVEAARLFEHYGAEHSRGGGRHRYFRGSGMDSHEVVWTQGGPVPIFPAALGWWCEHAVKRLSDIADRGSEWPVGRTGRSA